MIRKIFLSAAVLCSTVAMVFAAQEPEFSADMRLSTGGHELVGKVYHKEGKIRCEMLQGVTITRLDKGISYVLMPANKTYMEQPIDKQAAAQIGDVGQGELERVPMGEETVVGRSTQKFKVTYGDANGNLTMFQWLDAKDIPVKMQAGDGSWTVEYNNVEEGSQPDELFEVPADYQTFAMPAMPDMMGQGDGANSMQDILQKAKEIAQEADDSANNGG